LSRGGGPTRVGEHYNAPSRKKFQKNLLETLKFDKTLP